MSAPIRFDQRVAIVTGGGGGLGRAHSLELARRGATVLVNDISPEAARSVVAEIIAQGGKASANTDSVTDGEQIVRTTLEQFGRIDLLINNAGILRDRSFLKMSAQDWDAVMDIHLRAAFTLTHAAWPHMREAGFGRIVNTSSASGLYGNFGQANYSAAKMGLVGLTRTLAAEGRKYNILVNAIAPLAGSQMLASIAGEEVLSQLDPAMVSPLVARLCATHSEESGGLFEIGGGWVARVELARGAGLRLDGVDNAAEQLDADWKKLDDFSHSVFPRSLADSFRAALGTDTPD